MADRTIWQAKVLAFLHDPAEKALVMLRGKSHETGTVAAMKDLLGDELAEAREAAGHLDSIVRRADHWSSAADRPPLPMGRGARVVFASDPQLIHPLTGRLLRLQELASDIHVAHIENVSFSHLRELLVKEGEAIDWRRTFLKLWRFGPNIPAPDIGALWKQLPADTRSPDHTIWEHLGLSSAFAGALAGDREGGPALLLMSFGPVQGFISQARSVSDLWAGSHLLSRIAWEGIAGVCERYGPDAVLFPNLHGVPIGDVWIRKQLNGHWHGSTPEWMDGSTDTNPLFVAALPNRFVALVPAAAGRTLAHEIESRVRGWVRGRADEALGELLTAASLEDASEARDQIARQFAGFPEVHWALVPWALAGRERLDDADLKSLLSELGGDPVYLGDEALEGLVRREIRAGEETFFAPNPGVAYPGLFEALERLHASAKGVRPFEGSIEHGYRCTLCGEREWLTHDRSLLERPSDQRKTMGSLWSRLAEPALAKEGEHLCGHCALKRVWPRLFVREIKDVVPEVERVDRYVLSTHALALASSLWKWTGAGAPLDEADPVKGQAEAQRGVALPLRLVQRIHRECRERLRFARALPALLDAVADDEQQARPVRESIERLLGGKLETYYALVLMDGDRLGGWISGEEGRIALASRFHAETLADLRRVPELAEYLEAMRPPSPARHQAISTGLNGFALQLARPIVEELFMGKLIYAGGDDLLAMVAVRDLPGLMYALRCAYSGSTPAGESHDHFWRRLGTEAGGMRLGAGFALLDVGGERRLLRLMGSGATASIGAVIAHHQAPLSRVLADLRASEARAKSTNGGGRDAFCLTLTKRAGGTSHLIGKWALEEGWEGGDMSLLLDLRDLIGDRERGVSRRAVYALAEALRDLPPEADVLAAVMAYQFGRQARSEDLTPAGIAERLAKAALRPRGLADYGDEWSPPNRWLRAMLLTAEFLAREGRIEDAETRTKGEAA